MPSPLPPSNGSPSTLPSKSMTTRSPFAALCLAGAGSKLFWPSARRATRRVDRVVGRLDASAARCLRPSIFASGTSGRVSTSTVTTASLPGPPSSSATSGCIAGRIFCSAISCWTPSWTAFCSACCSSAGAVHLAHQIGGHLAGAEAGHPHLRRDRLQFLVDARVDVLGGNGDPIGALEALVQRLDSLHLEFIPSCQRVRPWCGRGARSWCGRRDSNPHIFRYQDLNLARLPVPPRPLRPPQAASITALALRARSDLPSWKRKVSADP